MVAPDRDLQDQEALMHILNARALKCTVVLEPAEVAQLVAPDGKPRVVLAIRLPDRRVSVDLNAKSVRKAVAAIAEHGPDGVAVIVQGKLVGDAITEAGIVAQPKVKPQTAAAAA
jgi:ribosomal protein S3